LRLRPAARNLPRPRRSPSHSGQPLPLVPVCSIRSCAAPTLPRPTRARACLRYPLVRGSFPSCLRLAARNLPRPHRSPSHSRQPLSPVPMCCAWAARSDPVPRRSMPRITRACACLLVLRVRGAGDKFFFVAPPYTCLNKLTQQALRSPQLHAPPLIYSRYTHPTQRSLHNLLKTTVDGLCLVFATFLLTKRPTHFAVRGCV
jgi:hypothetical protein